MQALGDRRLPAAKEAKTNGMWSRVQDKNSTSFTQECTVRLFLAVARSAGAAATSGVGLPGPAADHQNNFSSWRYLATWRARPRAVLPVSCASNSSGVVAASSLRRKEINQCKSSTLAGVWTDLIEAYMYMCICGVNGY